jgi:uncharacterized SAM-binding protein YcdF (DUF218 family)
MAGACRWPVSEFLKLFVMPSGVMLFALLGALVFALSWRTRRLAAALAILAGGIYLVFGNGPVAHWLLKGLEYRYPVVHELPALDHIVVLAAWALPDPYTTVIGQASRHALPRVTEAVYLARKHPGARITVTGAGTSPGVMAKIIEGLGVSADRIQVDESSSSTYESAVHLEAQLRGATFALVTSAGHMPRTIMVFEGQGLDPIPVPTGHLSYMNIWESSILPTPTQLHMSDLAVHEYLGLTWYRWRGRDGRGEAR